jgi:methylthioribose-1-phosphate isomerase
MLYTLEWTGESLRLLDQTKLPTETTYVDLTNEREAWDAIKRLVVRGAPAIGVAAAFGAYLGVRGSQLPRQRLREVCEYLATSRPTAVNLFWALDRIQRVVADISEDQISDRVLQECRTMFDEDIATCRKIGENGLKLLQSLSNQQPMNIITHCNAGSLATVMYGTALAPIYLGHEQGMKFHVFADETRPLLQGSRITAYELQKEGIPVTLQCDNMAASLMREKRIDAVIVGADRIAANGDTANKIGTCGLAIIARQFNVPFIVAAPTSTIDASLESGDRIPIEHRNSDEVTNPLGKVRIAPEGIEVYNPAFDVTPAQFISAIVTERKIHLAPYQF